MNDAPLVGDGTPVKQILPPGGKHTSNETAIRSLVDDIVSAWNDRDLDRFIGLLDESVVWDDPAMLYGPTTGRVAVRKFSESILKAFPDFSYRIREPICVAESGDRVVIPWEITATHTGLFDPPGFAPTEQPLTMQGVDVLELTDMKITRIDTFFNVLAATEQVLRLKPFLSGGISKVFVLWLQKCRAYWLRRSRRVRTWTVRRTSHSSQHPTQLDSSTNRSEHTGMRAPFQVLVIPFRCTAARVQFAVLKRSDAGYWQFVAGGGEDDETPLEAAQRETKEEIGIDANQRIIKLDSMATVPKTCFAEANSWGGDVFVVPEHCFAVDVGRYALTVSREHTELRWAEYEEAMSLLRWESNRNALWEVNERLKRPKPELVR